MAASELSKPIPTTSHLDADLLNGVDMDELFTQLGFQVAAATTATSPVIIMPPNINVNVSHNRDTSTVQQSSDILSEADIDALLNQFEHADASLQSGQQSTMRQIMAPPLARIHVHEVDQLTSRSAPLTSTNFLISSVELPNVSQALSQAPISPLTAFPQSYLSRPSTTLPNINNTAATSTMHMASPTASQINIPSKLFATTESPQQQASKRTKTSHNAGSLSFDRSVAAGLGLDLLTAHPTRSSAMEQECLMFEQKDASELPQNAAPRVAGEVADEDLRNVCWELFKSTPDELPPEILSTLKNHCAVRKIFLIYFACRIDARSLIHFLHIRKSLELQVIIQSSLKNV